MKNLLRCLLIDDDAEDKDFFNYALRKIDPDILLQYSPSGEDAIKNLKAGNYKPDYIFLDLNMHPMNGIECLREIKKIPGCTDIPVIMYSTSMNEELKYKTLSLGAFDHFEKPSNQGKLEDYLKKVMQVN